MKETANLEPAIRMVLGMKQQQLIAVHFASEQALGVSIAKRLAPDYGAKAEDLTFIIVPNDYWLTYPVGAIIEKWE